MKTLFPLTSRGRVRVFFNDFDKPGGAEGKIADAKAVIGDEVRKALTTFSLVVLNAVTPVSDASAQAPEPTWIAAATVTPGSECMQKDDLGRMRCKRAALALLNQEHAVVLKEKQRLTQILTEQQATIARLNAEALGDVHAFWSGYAPVIRALGLDANGLREYFKEWSAKLDNVLSVVVQNRFGDWELAQKILNARAGQGKKSA